MVLLTLASGQFLMTLDSSVMNVAIATVRDIRTPCPRRNLPPEGSPGRVRLAKLVNRRRDGADAGDRRTADAGIVTIPLLLAGLGIGALASDWTR